MDFRASFISFLIQPGSGKIIIRGGLECQNGPRKNQKRPYVIFLAVLIAEVTVHRSLYNRRWKHKR